MLKGSFLLDRVTTILRSLTLTKVVWCSLGCASTGLLMDKQDNYFHINNYCPKNGQCLSFSSNSNHDYWVPNTNNKKVLVLVRGAQALACWRCNVAISLPFITHVSFTTTDAQFSQNTANRSQNPWHLEHTVLPLGNLYRTLAHLTPVSGSLN